MLIYPASNGYNSYFDKDEDSIGGLKKPPKVDKELYWISLIFDGVAYLIGFIIGWQFVLMSFIYGLVSKAYSHPSIRLKKLPIIGWISAGIFQGYFTFLMVLVGIGVQSVTELLKWEYQFPALLSTLLLFGSYPMTQVYQHEEDGRRGDETISRKLGILGTFHFTAIMFLVSTAGYVWFFMNTKGWIVAIVFIAVLTPVLVFFSIWYMQVRKDRKNADFDRTMKLNLYSSSLLNLFFLWLWLM
jgi:1,4-dihydroxy-2-naphthoate octaprenyltransferase